MNSFASVSSLRDLFRTMVRFRTVVPKQNHSAAFGPQPCGLRPSRLSLTAGWRRTCFSQS